MSLRSPVGCVLVVGILGLVANSGCATMFSASNAEMILGSRPGIDVYVDGAYLGREPLTVELTNHHSHTIAVGDPSRPTATCTLVPGIGVGWVVLDFCFLVWPLLIDAVTGNWSTLDVDPCRL